MLDQYPNRNQYEVTPSSSEDSDSSVRDDKTSRRRSSTCTSYHSKLNKQHLNSIPIARRLNNKTTLFKASCTTTLQSPPPSPIQTQSDIEANQNMSTTTTAAASKISKTNLNAACIRHCGTSCASVLFQSICAIIAILGAVWIGFVALSWLEIIGISSLPPGVKYGHKVNDIY